jgi:hypothetical protein
MGAETVREETFVGWRYSETPAFYRAGWPMLSMQSIVTYHENSNGDEQTGWSLPLREIVHRGPQTEMLPDWLQPRRGARLPLIPMWPGFAVDVAIYCALFMGGRYGWLRFGPNGNWPTILRFVPASKIWLFKLSVVVSLALFLSVLALWFRSNRVRDQLNLTKTWQNEDLWGNDWEQASVGISSNLGRLKIGCKIFCDEGFPMPARTPPARYRLNYCCDPSTNSMDISGKQFRLWRDPFNTPSGKSDELALVLPDWSVALGSLIPAGWLMTRMRIVRQRDRRQNGLCLSCGYDLRATPVRCPECGLVATDRGPCSAQPNKDAALIA